MLRSSKPWLPSARVSKLRTSPSSRSKPHPVSCARPAWSCARASRARPVHHLAAAEKHGALQWPETETCMDMPTSPLSDDYVEIKYLCLGDIAR